SSAASIISPLLLTATAVSRWCTSMPSQPLLRSAAFRCHTTRTRICNLGNFFSFSSVYMYATEQPVTGCSFCSLVYLTRRGLLEEGVTALKLRNWLIGLIGMA